MGNYVIFVLLLGTCMQLGKGLVWWETTNSSTIMEKMNKNVDFEILIFSSNLGCGFHLDNFVFFPLFIIFSEA
jgi:hypothetical protein